MTAPALERRLAALLSSGTWIASAVIAVGLARSEQIVSTIRPEARICPGARQPFSLGAAAFRYPAPAPRGRLAA